MAEKVTRASVEKSNKATAMSVLQEQLEQVYGACYPVEDGYAVQVGKSPLDGAPMWVVFPYPKSKPVQTYKWGKTERKYYNGYDAAKAYAVELKEKADKKAESKRLSAEKAERDKVARAKKKAEKGE